MSERGIIMSGPMVRAILEGRKTQTRRVVKPQPDSMKPLGDCGAMIPYRIGREVRDMPGVRLQEIIHCPYGQPGDRLWLITIKPITRNPRYGAGDDGHIYRIDKPLPTKMRSAPNGRGYETVTLCERGKKGTALVHLLVCEAFYGPKPEIYDEARHLDGDKSNNTPDNLDWGTRQQNWSDRRFKGRGVRAKHLAAKITEEQAAEIRNSVYSQRVLAKKYGLSQSTVGLIKQGNIWNPISAQSEPPNAARWASRITLEITGVRVERLQEISREDAKSEGVSLQPTELYPDVNTGDKLREQFRKLWDSINGVGAWDKNLWVWVITFKRV